MARTARILQALADLAAFALVAAGTPIALLALHGTPGHHITTAATTLRDAITGGRVDLLTGDTIAAPIAALAWAGWALLIITVTAATIAQLRGQLRPSNLVARAPNFVRRIAASAALIISLASRTTIAGAAPHHRSPTSPRSPSPNITPPPPPHQRSQPPTRPPLRPSSSPAATASATSPTPSSVTPTPGAPCATPRSAPPNTTAPPSTPTSPDSPPTPALPCPPPSPSPTPTTPSAAPPPNPTTPPPPSTTPPTMPSRVTTPARLGEWWLDR